MHSLNLNHLVYFHAVAEESSVSAAARRLDVTKATVSEQLRSLEDGLEARLFDRVAGRLELNEQGRVAFRHAATIVETVRSLLDELSGDEGGSVVLRVGVARTVARRVAGDFFLPLTRLDARPILSVDAPEVVAERVRRRELDFGLIEHEPHDERLASKVLRRSRWIGVAKEPREADLTTLLRTTPLVRHRSGGEAQRAIDDLVRTHVARPRVAAESDDLPTVLAMVEAGVGMAFVPEMAVLDVIASGRLARVAELRVRADLVAITAGGETSELVEQAISSLLDE
ncbi:MAG: LysR family transcriptional regulator [Sandaracinus sp.]|nr:LysR family transcriptional regulator [Sandaracinus sp.]